MRVISFIFCCLLFALTAVRAADTPDLALSDLDGAAHKLSDWRGQVVVLNFWATWCGPCRKEMPVLQELAQRYAGRQVQFVAVSVDTAQDLPQVKKYVADKGLTFHIWAGAVDDDMKRFGLTALPGTVVIDRQGQVVWRYTSVVDKKELSAQIDKWLARRGHNQK